MNVTISMEAPETNEIYTLSLHDALPICAVPHDVVVDDVEADREAHAHSVDVEQRRRRARRVVPRDEIDEVGREHPPERDRKSTRLNSSHSQISYAVFCLKKRTAAENSRT